VRHVDTFFRGHRRETRIEAASILCNTAGEKRLKLSMRIPLAGDQLVGMPAWVSEPFSAMAKPDFAGKHWASEMELDPMLLHIFAMPQSEKEVMTFDAVRLTGFKIEHDHDDPEHPSLALTFTAYVPRTGKFLKFADDNFGSSLFIRFEAAQGSLLDDNPNIQPIDAPRSASATHTLVEDEEEVVDDEGNGGDDDEGDEEEPETKPEEEAAQGSPESAAAPIHAAARRGRKADAAVIH
jgi:hypothetical protein